jgi:ribosomal protein S21
MTAPYSEKRRESRGISVDVKKIRGPRDVAVDKALKILRKKMEKENVGERMSRRRFYVKPSEKRRRQKNARRAN